jgi:hypothetical protein
MASPYQNVALTCAINNLAAQGNTILSVTGFVPAFTVVYRDINGVIQTTVLHVTQYNRPNIPIVNNSSLC